MKPAPFAYHRARDVAEAAELLARLGEDAKILAGGQSLVPMMNFRLARPSDLVDITGIDQLRYVRRDAGGLHVGALTRHRDIEISRDRALLDGFAVLPRSARWIGHYPIRARGTFGGSIAHADPAAEWCLLAVLLDAYVVLAGQAGQRTVPAAEFFEGFYTTAARPDEIITEICFPRPAPRAALTELSYRQGDFAVVAAAVTAEISGRTVDSVRVVLGGVGPRPVLADMTSLAGEPAADATWQAAGQLAAGQADPPSDLHASADYRRQLTGTLVARALAEAAGRPGAPRAAP